MVRPGRVAFAALAAGLFGARTPDFAHAEASVANADTAQQGKETIPIRVERIRLTQAGGKTVRTWVVLWYRNQAKVTAGEVRFSVRYDGAETAIVDKGTFSPAVLVAHAFIVPRAPTARATPEVAVQYVEYADGTHWGDP